MEEVNIIRKINGLLNLASSANEHEAQAAMLKAQAMLIENELEEQTVRALGKEMSNPKATEIEVWSSVNRVEWVIGLMRVIPKNFRCSWYFTNPTRKMYNDDGSPWWEKRFALNMIGLPKDLEIAKVVFNSAMQFMDRLSKEYVTQYFAEHPWIKRGIADSRAVRTSWYMGFLFGLDDQFTAARRAMNQCQALILVKPQAVIERETQLNLRNASLPTKVSATEREAYHAGREQGRNWSSMPLLEGANR